MEDLTRRLAGWWKDWYVSTAVWNWARDMDPWRLDDGPLRATRLFSIIVVIGILSVAETLHVKSVQHNRDLISNRDAPCEVCSAQSWSDQHLFSIIVIWSAAETLHAKSVQHHRGYHGLINSRDPPCEVCSASSWYDQHQRRSVWGLFSIIGYRGLISSRDAPCEVCSASSWFEVESAVGAPHKVCKEKGFCFLADDSFIT